MFFEAYGWTPEILLNRTLRELVAYSKQINLSGLDRRKFQAALVDKKIEMPSGIEEHTISDQKVRDRLDEIAEMNAKRIAQMSAQRTV